MPALGQSFEFIGGVRQIGSNDTQGYGTLTYGPGGLEADGVRLRVTGTGSNSHMFTTRVRQRSMALTGGYSWRAGDAGSFALMAGPTYVRRTEGGVSTIDEVGILASAEYAGFVGERGFAVAYAEYSSPDRALFARAFYSHYTTDQFGIGPDISYLSEPDFSRLNLGVRASYVVGATVLSATVGHATTKNDLDPPTNRSPFLELQVATRY
ncbi:cellulose biosynthesis protein BcsS [Alkalilacustris brevis]|uniref:cellulose biosynthesis protein BcsS n=1 Tax=Alkalilacustris brevis TaxID=2026338 RepID=UPI000E0D5166|nr:cellulose biosynthesis protein BcsS [Alkalilacustris brevis]